MMFRITLIPLIASVVSCGPLESKKTNKKSEAMVLVKSLPISTFKKPNVIVPDKDCSFQKNFIDWYQHSYLTNVSFKVERCDYSESSNTAFKDNYQFPDFPCAKDRTCSYQFVSLLNSQLEKIGEINLILQTVNGITQGHVLDTVPGGLFMPNDEKSKSDYESQLNKSPDKNIPLLLVTYDAIVN